MAASTVFARRGVGAPARYTAASYTNPGAQHFSLVVFKRFHGGGHHEKNTPESMTEDLPKLRNLKVALFPLTWSTCIAAEFLASTRRVSVTLFDHEDVLAGEQVGKKSNRSDSHTCCERGDLNLNLLVLPKM